MVKDPAIAAPSRLVMAAFLSLLVIGGLLFLGLGVIAVVDGLEASWLIILGGLHFTVLGVLGSTMMLRSRHAPGPAVEVDDGVALPLRHRYTVRQTLMSLTLGTMFLPMALHDHNPRMIAFGSIALILGMAAAVWLPLGGADSFRIRLTPDELVIPTGWGPVQRFSWRQIERVLVVPRWQPMLLVIPKEDDAKNGLVKVLGQGWDSQALTRVIEYYAKHASRRSDLTSAAAVEAVAFGSVVQTSPKGRR